MQCEECLEEEQQSQEPEENVNRQQRYRPRKQLTRNRNVHNMDSSLVGYLGRKKAKNTKKIWWSSEHTVATGRQRKCNTISGRISYLALNSRVNNIENIEDTFHLYFDNDIMDKIVDCTNTRINETIARLQQSDNFNESSKYTWVKKTDRVEIDALFGLVYFRGILGENLHMTDRLFLNESHFFWCNNIKKPFQIS